MQLEPSKQHPHGGVVVEALVALNAGQHNKGEIIGLSIQPTQKQIDDGSWDAKARVEASEELIEKTVNTKDKTPGLRRYVPQVNRQALKLADQMKQFDDMCRQVARGVYELEFCRDLIKALEKNQALNPDQLAHLKARFASAEIERDKMLAKRAKEEAMGMTGMHQAEVQFKLQAEQLAAQEKLIAELQRQVSQLAAKK